MSDRLPMLVLLGTDVPQLVELFNGVGQETEPDGDGGQARDVRVVTRSQQEAPLREEEEQLENHQKSGVRPSLVDEVETTDPMGDGEGIRLELENAMIGAEFHDDLLMSGKVRPRMTRSQKKANKRNHGGGGSCQSEKLDEINLTRAEVEKLQTEDPTLIAERVTFE